MGGSSLGLVSNGRHPPASAAAEADAGRGLARHRLITPVSPGHLTSKSNVQLHRHEKTNFFGWPSLPVWLTHGESYLGWPTSRHGVCAAVPTNEPGFQQ